MTDDQDDDAPPTVDLVAEIFTHVLRMAGRHGIAIDEAPDRAGGQSHAG
jgi:hypothetical protein